jgi:hypothetical protein
MEETSGILSLALGGALLMLNIFFILETAAIQQSTQTCSPQQSSYGHSAPIALLLLDLGLY